MQIKLIPNLSLLVPSKSRSDIDILAYMEKRKIESELTPIRCDVVVISDEGMRKSKEFFSKGNQ